MNNFDIVNVNINQVDTKVLIMMKTSESPFDFLNEIQEYLKNLFSLHNVQIVDSV